MSPIKATFTKIAKISHKSKPIQISRAHFRHFFAPNFVRFALLIVQTALGVLCLTQKKISFAYFFSLKHMKAPETIKKYPKTMEKLTKKNRSFQ